MYRAYRTLAGLHSCGFLGVLLLVLFESASPAADSLTWRKEKDSVDANIRSWSLVRTLESIAEMTGWQVYLEPGTQRKVSTTFQNRSKDKALDFLLPNLDRALLPGTNGGPPRLLVFRSTQREATRRIRSRRKGIPNELIVTMKRGKSVDSLAKELGAKVVAKSEGLHSARLQFASEEAAENAREDLLNNEDVVSVDPNFPISPLPTPEGSGAPALPELKLAPVTPGEALVIGLIDSAVQGPPDDFVLPGINAPCDSPASPDFPTHGTAMKDALRSGIAMFSDCSKGTRVRVLPVDVYGCNPTTTTYEVAEGIYQAMQKGANVINLSLGSEGDTPYLHDVIKKGADAGYVFVASAGNTPVTSPTFPAAYDEVIAVTAGDAKGKLAPYANHGDFVDVMAPGNSFVKYNGKTFRVSGTSPAAAYISGAIAGQADCGGLGLRQSASAVLKALPPPAPGP
jgi:hypothetical protein